MQLHEMIILGLEAEDTLYRNDVGKEKQLNNLDYVVDTKANTVELAEDTHLEVTFTNIFNRLIIKSCFI